jgi:hypothetical protein
MGGAIFDPHDDGGGAKNGGEFCQGGQPGIFKEIGIRHPIDIEIRSLYAKLHEHFLRLSGAVEVRHTSHPSSPYDLKGGGIGEPEFQQIDRTLVATMRKRLIQAVTDGREADATYIRAKMVIWEHAQPDYVDMCAQLALLIERYNTGLAKLNAGEFATPEASEKARKAFAKLAAEGQALCNEIGLVRPWLLEGVALPWL